MELDIEARPPDDTHGWRRSLAVLALLIAIVVAAQLYAATLRDKGSEEGSSARSQALISGDFYIKLDQAWPSGSSTAAALRNYTQALPWPSAYRRLGVMKESYGKSGAEDLAKLDSSKSTRGMDKKDIAKLRREKAMWLHIFGPGKLSSSEARGYIKRIEALNLGPLKSAAIARVYWHSGDNKKYDEVRAESKAAAQRSIGAWFLLLGLLLVGGTAGLVGAVLFLTRTAPRFASATRLPLDSSMLMSAFIVYLASFIGLSGLAEVVGEAVGFTAVAEWSGLAYMALVILSAVSAFVLGMVTLLGRARMMGQDWRQIGFRTANAGRDVMLGISGFFSSLPFVFAGAIIAAILNKTIFRSFQTPEQPFEEIVSNGGVAEIVIVIVAAAVIAPIVEETFFRGALFSAFRTKMAVWPSVLVTSAVFAVIHPLPGGFLPIFILACVLALLRERSGSLLPCMVCHGLYNSVVLVVMTLIR